MVVAKLLVAAEHDPHDTTHTSEESSGKDSRDIDFPRQRHLQAPDAGNRNNKDDDVGDCVDRCGD